MLRLYNQRKVAITSF